MKKNTIGIIGLGYVGLTLSILAEKKNFKVIGFDTDRTKILLLQNKKNYISGYDNEIKKMRINKYFFPTFDFSRLSECEYIIVCVPTPLKQNKPNLIYIEKAFKDISKYLKKNQTIILESTTYPGTTTEMELKYLKPRKIKYYLAYSPERVNPSDTLRETYNATKIIGADKKFSLLKAKKFYSKIFKKIALTNSTKKAEVSKLYENIYRSINISFVNEMKFLLRKFQIDIWDVIELCKTKEKGFTAFYPGPGTGGHCIPIDPTYFLWKINKIGYDSKFIKASNFINNNTTNIIKQNVLKICKRIKKKRIKILILGVAYKKNVNDIRESAIVKLLTNLLNYKHSISYYDPFIANLEIYKNRSKHKIFSEKTSIKNLKKFDLVILGTDHDKFNYKKIFKESKLLIDLRNRSKKFKKFEKKLFKF